MKPLSDKRVLTMARWNELPEHLKSRVKEYPGEKSAAKVINALTDLSSSLTGAEKTGMEDLAKPTPQHRTQALGRMPAGKMNATERAYAAILEARKFAGEILWWAFEPINIRLADKCFFKVDFLVLPADGYVQAVEVKGGGGFTDDALVKIKVAASLLPFKFISMQLVKGEWIKREF